jgi:hypothetical protein
LTGRPPTAILSVPGCDGVGFELRLGRPRLYFLTGATSPAIPPRVMRGRDWLSAAPTTLPAPLYVRPAASSSAIPQLLCAVRVSFIAHIPRGVTFHGGRCIQRGGRPLQQHIALASDEQHVLCRLLLEGAS